MKVIVYEEETGNYKELNIKNTKEELLELLNNCRKNINFENIIKEIQSLKESNNNDEDFICWLNVSNIIGSVVAIGYTSEEAKKYIKTRNYSFYKLFTPFDDLNNVDIGSEKEGRKLDINFCREMLKLQKDLEDET